MADHLSSRAYMELASRFPAHPRRQLQAAAAGSFDGAGKEQGLAGSSNPADGSAGAGNGAGDGNGSSSSGSGWGGGSGCEDSVDWEAVRLSSREQLADAIKCRGMQHRCGTAAVRHCTAVLDMPVAVAVAVASVLLHGGCGCAAW